MKTLITTAVLFMYLICSAEQFVDVYKVTLVLKVPRVFNNTQSRGYRKMQANKITGYMGLDWGNGSNTTPELVFSDFVNQTHKVSGKKVTYKVHVNYPDEYTLPLFVWLGNNGTGVFKTPAWDFSAVFDPSYNISGKENQDNTMYLNFSGYGSSNGYKCYRVASKVRGYVTGRQGCTCSSYSHLSPTRLINWYGYCPTQVTDVAPVMGHFTATWIKKESRGN